MRNLTSYELHTGKLKKPVIFGVVSDLHDEPYDDLWPLLAAATRCWCRAMWSTDTPRLPPGESLFCRMQPRRLPTFFSLGNHETKTRQFQALMQALNGTGAEILVNRYVPFGECWIGGWYDPEIVRQPDCMDEFERLPGCRVLLCHKPEHYIKFLRGRDMDLVVAGHAHGGQIRIGSQGLYAPGSISFRNTPRAS